MTVWGCTYIRCRLGDSQIAERKALQASRLLDKDFTSAMATVRASIDVFGTTHPFARQTTFDELALEHGLGIDTVFAMMHVQETLKESRCLSVGMDWDSPLVRCSVFFWTCAILKVREIPSLTSPNCRHHHRFQMSNNLSYDRVLLSQSANSIRCSNYSIAIVLLSVISLKVTLPLVPLSLHPHHIHRIELAVETVLGPRGKILMPHP